MWKQSRSISSVARVDCQDDIPALRCLIVYSMHSPLSFIFHINLILAKLSKAVYILRSSQNILTPRARKFDLGLCVVFQEQKCKLCNRKLFHIILCNNELLYIPFARLASSSIRLYVCISPKNIFFTIALVAELSTVPNPLTLSLRSPLLITLISGFFEKTGFSL